jgi:cysteinyl-tRNA synthetase
MSDASTASGPRPARIAETRLFNTRFFNTLGRRLEPLAPLAPPAVRIYTCGPTVYNHVHIGNLRTFLFEDVLRRSLRYLGYDVTQVMNLTDVDDKTIRGAQEAGVSLDDYTAPFIESFFADLGTLHVERAELYPRATRHVPEMVAITQRLLDAGVAYVNEGSVWFRIAADPDYGKLSGIDLAEVKQGDRVASDEYGKEDVRDFVLWKGAKPGEPSWESPWGPGRPGWHIECSAMAMKYLGETFDIHCGGVDNMFPHHENEIAQSESATGKPFARLWLHSEHLVVDGQKMAKSLGNFYTLKELVAQGRDPRAIRYLLLSVHYRQKLNFTFEALDAAAAALARVDDLKLRLETATEAGEERGHVAVLAATLAGEFAAALADDLNTSGALGALFKFVKAVNVAVDGGRLGRGDRERIGAALADADRVLGVLDGVPWQGGAPSGPDDAEVERLIEERQAARRGRDFRRADEIRARLAAQGIVLEDTPGGTRWKRIRAGGA